MYIPSYNEFITIASDLLVYSYSSSASTSGYTIVLNVKTNDGRDVMRIDVDIRFIAGQMDGLPSSKSKMSLKITPADWNEMFIQKK